MDVHADIMSCLQALRFDVGDLSDFKAHQCLSNFVDVCGWLYTAEADDEQEIVKITESCRREIYEAHKHSVKLLEVLIDSEEESVDCSVDEVLHKMQELIEVSEMLDKLDGKPVNQTDEEPAQPGNIQRTSSRLLLFKTPADKDSENSPKELTLTTKIPSFNHTKDIEDKTELSLNNENGVPIPKEETKSDAGKTLNTHQTNTIASPVNNLGNNKPALEDTQTKPISNDSIGHEKALVEVEPDVNQALVHSNDKDGGFLETTLARTTDAPVHCVDKDKGSSKSNKLGCSSETSLTRATHLLARSIDKDGASSETTLTRASNPLTLTRDVINGLRNLADVSSRLKSTEKEMSARNKLLSQRLEVLKQEAASHPAIEAYIARNCYSPLAAKGRRDEYAQYACAMERVLKRIKKTTDALHISRNNDLASIEGQMPELKALSDALAVLHNTTQEASGYQDENETVADQRDGSIENLHNENKLDDHNHDLPENPRVSDADTTLPHYGMQCRATSFKQCCQGSEKDERHKTDITKMIAEKLAVASASIGRVRYFVDGSLGNIAELQAESNDQPNRHSRQYLVQTISTTTTITNKVINMGTASTTSTSVWDTVLPHKPKQEFNSTASTTIPASEELLAIDMLQYLPMDDKDCRAHLLSGADLLASAVENLLHAANARTKSVDARALLDAALCRPFSETSILRLELLHLLSSVDEAISGAIPGDARSSSRSNTKRRECGNVCDAPTSSSDKARGRVGVSDRTDRKYSKSEERDVGKKRRAKHSVHRRRSSVSPIAEEPSRILIMSPMKHKT